MSKSVEETRRELFENWFNNFQLARLNRGYDEYTSWELTLMNMAFNAALDAVEIELPNVQFNEYTTYNEAACIGEGIASSAVAIKKLNLGLKIK